MPGDHTAKLEESRLSSSQNVISQRDEYLAQLSERLEQLKEFSRSIKDENRRFDPFRALLAVLYPLALPLLVFWLQQSREMVPSKNPLIRTVTSLGPITAFIVYGISCCCFAALFYSMYSKRDPRNFYETIREVGTNPDTRKLIDILPADQHDRWAQLQNDLYQITQGPQQLGTRDLLPTLINIQTQSANARTLGDLFTVLNALIEINKKTSEELREEHSGTVTSSKYAHCEGRFFPSLQKTTETASRVETAANPLDDEALSLLERGEWHP